MIAHHYYHHHQYSSYVTHVIGVQLILIRLEYQKRMCPKCNANNNELTSFPIMPNESFTFIYNDKQGLELGFKPRLKGDTA